MLHPVHHNVRATSPHIEHPPTTPTLAPVNTVELGHPRISHGWQLRRDTIRRYLRQTPPHAKKEIVRLTGVLAVSLIANKYFRFQILARISEPARVILFGVSLLVLAASDRTLLKRTPPKL